MFQPTRYTLPNTFETLNNENYEMFLCCIEATCLALHILRFLSEELKFLNGYATVLRPLSIALDILQGDQNVCYLGYVLPNLKKLYNAINKIDIPEVSSGISTV